MTGVRPGRRTTSMASPSIFRRRAQSVMRPTARSRWPCSAQCTSNIGDLAGMRMYSVRVGTMSSSQARWTKARVRRSEEHTSELQSQSNLVCRLLLEKKKKNQLSYVLSSFCFVVSQGFTLYIFSLLLHGHAPSSLHSDTDSLIRPICFVT